MIFSTAFAAVLTAAGFFIQDAIGEHAEEVVFTRDVPRLTQGLQHTP
jgi:hypothetical protein